MKTLMGTPSSSQSSSKTGYSSLSKALKAAFDPLGEAVGQFTNPNNPGVTEAFTPTPFSAAENNAVGNINAGFAPTADSIKSDMALQMNPYNDSVISEINRQGNGDFSVMKQALANAGQSGSNREILGANDVDLSRMNQIGGFLNNQFNTSMDNALTTMPLARATDAQGQLGVGDMIRKLAMQTAQAPVAALQSGTNMIAPFTAGGTTQSTETGAQKGLFDYAAQVASGAKYSDPILKENIVPKGQENGHNVYEFNYRGEQQKFIGVMADEVQQTNPEAVEEVNGYLAVNYDKIGVKFREA